MQKKIIALAVAGLVSGGAFAQSSVTIYGLFDVSLVTNSSKGSGKTYGINSSAIGSTHLGFRGTEALGNGLQAFFNLKENLNVLTGGAGSGSSGATTAGYNDFNSAANVGLAGGFGTVTLGRQTNLVFGTVGAVDAFNMASLGIGQQWGMANTSFSPGTNPLTNLAPALSTNTAGGARLPLAYAGGIGYSTPKFGGFQAKLFGTFGNNMTGAPYSDNGIREVAASYNNGPIAAAWAYGVVSSRAAASATTGVFPAIITEVKHNVLGGSYKFGSLKVAAAWFKVKYDASLQATNHDNSAWSLGTTYTMGPMVYGVEYTAGKDDITTSNKDNILSYMARYSMSKRTELYGLLGTVQNKGNASIQPIWSSPSLVTAPLGATVVNALDARNGRNTSLALGLRHAF